MNEKNEILIDDNYLDENYLTEKELLKCKENGFILLGKTGVGKTSLLNILVNNEVGKVGHSSKSETKVSNFYCYKEIINNELIYYCIIDTPGLYDTNGVEADINQKKDIQNLIAKEKIKIKGILFLSNFQNERFDFSEQKTLIEYNALFPMKEFWKRLIIVFTHYYGDPEGDSKEEIQERSTKCFTQIIETIMEKVKNVSDPIDFNNINKKYVNIYSKAKKDKQLKNNESIRNSLINEIYEYTKLNPMFNNLQIFHFEKYEINENDEYIYDCDLIIYLDANNNVINKDFNIIKKYPKSMFTIIEPKILYNIQRCEINEQGNLIKSNMRKEGEEEIFGNIKYKLGSSVTILSFIGIICSGFFFPAIIPVCITTFIGGIVIMKKAEKEQEKDEQDKINEIIEKNKIKEELRKEVNNY